MNISPPSRSLLRLAALAAVAWTYDVAASATPEFAIRTARGQFRAYADSAHGESGYAVRDELLEATVANLGAGSWELRISNKGQVLEEIWFPWESGQTSLGSIADDVVYYPRFMGVAADADALKEWDWWGRRYPGEVYAPLVVVADETEARMVAAVNWPPKIVTPLFSRGRLALRYDKTFAASTTETFRALLVGAIADAGKGECAWRRALVPYKSWLHDQMRTAGLYPIEYPEDLRNAHGWMHVSLHWMTRFDVKELRRVYQGSRNVFPWIQFWGQMSNYHRHVEEGRAGVAEPSLAPDESVGCCLEESHLHPRYLPDLPMFAEEVKAAGGIVGYYQRPPRPYNPLDAPNSESLQFLTDWIADNEANGANAFYLDVVGAVCFGEPLPVAHLLQDTFPRMSVIEHVVDMYPSAALISGSLWGLFEWDTRPGQTPEHFGPSLKRVTFPRFGRYLLDDRLIFLGRSNGDFMWWGKYRGHQHWSERQAFLLGAKLDAPTTFKGQRGWIDPVNPVVAEIVREWERADWWRRRPAYRDRAGIYGVSPGIDVRKFVDRAGITLFAVENWKKKRDQSFMYRGRQILVPERRLCIMTLPPTSEPKP